MTRKRNDIKNIYCPYCKKLVKKGVTESIEFGLWLRKQKEIDSTNRYNYGGYFTGTNIDYFWRDYKTKDFMFIEEKRYKSKVTYAQRESFVFLDNVLQCHPKYHGFHILQFENTSPEDGKIFLDHKEITKEELIKFLRFEMESCWLKPVLEYF